MKLTIIDARISRRLQRLRRARKIPLAVLARQAALDRRDLAAIEAGTRRATLPELLRIVAALQLTLRDLYTGIGRGLGHEATDAKPKAAPFLLLTSDAQTQSTVH